MTGARFLINVTGHPPTSVARLLLGSPKHNPGSAGSYGWGCGRALLPGDTPDTHRRTAGVASSALAASGPVSRCLASSPPALGSGGPSWIARHRTGCTRYVLTGAGPGDMAVLGDAESGRPWTTQEAVVAGRP